MEEDELFFLSFLLLTGWTADMMDYGDVRCVNLTSRNYFPQNSLSHMFPSRAGHREIYVGDLESFRHFIALTPVANLLTYLLAVTWHSIFPRILLQRLTLGPDVSIYLCDNEPWHVQDIHTTRV